MSTSNMASTMSAIAKRMAGVGNDAKFFTTTKKGETHELRQELNHQSRDKKKSAVKKVIANMTVGKDVSMLFTDVVNCMQTGDTQLKKLVYLYLINYAKSNPDLTILAVNTFVKDANDPNPLIRALAIRTMGCIRVERIIEYLCEPLRRCLQDDDPYVRKTAAICVAKLYDINAEMVEDQGFLEQLRELLGDSNPTVVANAVAALSEIADGGIPFKVTKSMLQKLLAALNECTEWGQVFVLDALATYTAANTTEAEGIIERVTPRLQHANSAVVLSAIKVMLRNFEFVEDDEVIKSLSRKMAPSLITLLSTEPEIQYVALRNINLIVQKRPSILSHEIKVFFCKYNDPIYVKMEKLEIIIRLVNERNVDQVLLELKEYATEVDVDFVRRSVRAIGQCAIKLSAATDRCIKVLLELIQTQVNYIVQEAIVVIKDIFRKYPNQYESIIATLCENLDTLDEPEAKASMIWIIGEYAERIDGADEILESFLEGFYDEPSSVQLQLLTACVKLFLKCPDDAQEMVQKVLHMATEESENPDLRDRGYVYWRLLSSNPEAAKAVVLGEKPTIKDDSYSLDSGLLDQLIAHIATLSSVYHKLPESFVAPSVHTSTYMDDESEEEEDDILSPKQSDDPSPPSQNGAVDLLDLGGLDMNSPPPIPSTSTTLSNDFDDLFGTPSSSNPPQQVPLPVLLTGESGKGILLKGQLVRQNNRTQFSLHFENQSQSQPLEGIAIQFNKNPFGLTSSTSQVSFLPALTIGNTQTIPLDMTITPKLVNPSSSMETLQAAIKNTTTGSVSYFTATIDLFALLIEGEAMDKATFVNKWKQIDTPSVITLPLLSMNAIDSILRSKNIYQVTKRPNTNNGTESVYYSFTTITNEDILFELNFSSTEITFTLKTNTKSFGEGYASAIRSLMT